MINVRFLTSNDEKQWDEYVSRCEQGTIFHQLFWKRIIEETFGFASCYLLAEAHGKICGVLPLFHVHSIFAGNALISTPFAVYGGILAEKPDAVPELVRAAKEITQGRKASYLELRQFVKCDHPALLMNDALYFTFRKNLQPCAEANFQRLPKEARRMVRKAEKLGLTARFENDLDGFYEIYAASVRNLGTPVFPKKLFANCLASQEIKSDILLIDYEGAPVAGVLSFYSKDTVYPYYGGSLPSKKGLAPNNFMYWILMKSAAERGYCIFDFGRSKRDTGAFAFKRHLGFEPMALPYQYYLMNGSSLPNNNPTNPKYQYAIRLWRRLPLSLTKWIGPRIVRAFP
jgi:FemAB-related protein (PEP-CTERM system-associated)